MQRRVCLFVFASPPRTGTDLRETKTEHRAIPTILKIYNCSSKALRTRLVPIKSFQIDALSRGERFDQIDMYKTSSYAAEIACHTRTFCTTMCLRNPATSLSVCLSVCLSVSLSLSLSLKFSLRYRQIFLSRRGLVQFEISTDFLLAKRRLISDKSNKHKSGEKQTRAVGSTIVQVRRHKVFGAWRN
jgi:hypothetical protein